jgi:hypothetical protein
MPPPDDDIRNLFLDGTVADPPGASQARRVPGLTALIVKEER